MKNTSSVMMGLLVVASLSLSACGKEGSKTSNAESTSTPAACPALIAGKTISISRTGAKTEVYTLSSNYTGSNDLYSGKNTADIAVTGSYTYIADGTKANITLTQATPSSTTVSKFDLNCFVNQKGNYTLSRSFTDSTVTFGDVGSFELK